MMLVKGEVSWHSRMQEVTASSTSEEEDDALPEAVQGVTFLRQVQEFTEQSMRIDAVDVFEDNKWVIKLAVNKYASRST